MALTHPVSILTGGPGTGKTTCLKALITALAAQHKVEPSWIYVTPGSGELLRAATVAFTGASRSLVMASPTFEAPGRVAGMIGAPVQAVPVTADGHLDLDGMAAKAAGAGLFIGTAIYQSSSSSCFGRTISPN